MSSPTGTACTNGWLAPVVFLVGFVVLYFGAMPLLDDPDVPWHLATGRYLLETKHLPDTDPWSFASSNAPWYILSWLWNVFLGVAQQATGEFGVFLITISLGAGVLAMQATRLSHYAVDRQAIVLTLMFSTLCMVEFAGARPQLAGYLMILAFCHILHKSRRSYAYGTLWALPPLMLVWANSHGSFIAGFTILGAYGIEAIAAKNYFWLKRLLVISTICIITALFNPYSLDILSGAMQSIDSDVKAHLIEWQPFTLGKSLGLTVWLVVFVLASNLRNGEVPLADKILSMAWLVGMLIIMRNGAVFMLVSAPYLASCLDIQTRSLRQKRPESSGMVKLSGQSPRRLWFISAACAVIFASMGALLPHDGRIQSESRSIDDVIGYILKHQPKRRFLSDFDFGGQLIYRTAGIIPFFMDSRSNTAYSSKEMKNYLAYWLQLPGWESTIKGYGINGIIAHNHSQFARSYADGQYKRRWHLVFAGNAASVYISAP